MIGSTRRLTVFVFAAPVDMRKSFDTLSALVTNQLQRDLLSGDVFLFVGKDRRRAKVLFCGRHGTLPLFEEARGWISLRSAQWAEIGPTAVDTADQDKRGNWTTYVYGESAVFDGDTPAGGFYFPVTDYLGKPVLMLDSTQRIAGAADYDPFGLPNRVSLDAKTPHPIGTWSGDFANFTQGGYSPTLPLQMRARFQFMEGGSALGGIRFPPPPLWYVGRCYADS